MAIKKTWLILFFMLIIGIRLFAESNESTNWDKTDTTYTLGHKNTSEIQSPDTHNFIAIEINNCSQTISEVHRLMSVLILSNRIVPTSYDFRSTILTPLEFSFSSPVPIFIRGHSLLN